ncbi:uncharacterized protein STEHIDRAFT_161648 [Stereum hirsutum FP-91666 SS1]|uniref:uncharacterized protein n=1 Tax=Stereum hirsutum (strain FP-91666) TaxID=721885 RepID=UPI000444A5D5|nr:uncharacterized protein STEHIDRAFT_161648 [Stereum hirsutum FP-91666 SS1]EIM81458.1 hypothetical protein STEHIDRAFT_161648 [Stereum hirsutum FP-91666 SS1]
MSGRLLQGPDRPQDRVDDLEGFVHAIVYLAFRYQKSTIPDVDLARITAEVYDQYVDSGIPKGGEGKKAFFQGSTLDQDVVDASFPAPLADLISDLRDVFSYIYSSKPSVPRTYFSATKKQKRLAEIEAHTKRVADTLKALNDSSNELVEVFTHSLKRADWPRGDNVNTAMDHLPRTRNTGMMTQIDTGRQLKFHVPKRKRDGDSSSFKRIQSMVNRDLFTKRSLARRKSTIQNRMMRPMLERGAEDTYAGSVTELGSCPSTCFSNSGLPVSSSSYIYVRRHALEPLDAFPTTSISLGIVEHGNHRPEKDFTRELSSSCLPAYFRNLLRSKTAPITLKHLYTSSYTSRSAFKKAASSPTISHASWLLFTINKSTLTYPKVEWERWLSSAEIWNIWRRPVTESFPAPLADLINDLRQNFHILYLPSPQSLPPYFPEHQKKAREDAIKAHADQVTDIGSDHPLYLT